MLEDYLPGLASPQVLQFDPRNEEDDVKQVTARKPFVVPTVKELASLSSVTLVSGGGGGTPTGQST